MENLSGTRFLQPELVLVLDKVSFRAYSDGAFNSEPMVLTFRAFIREPKMLLLKR